MPYPWVNSDGSLRPFTTDEVKALKLETAEIAHGDHPTIELAPGGCSVVRPWFCDWSKSLQASAYMLGAASLAGTFPNWTLSRIMPQSFPIDGFQQYAALSVSPLKGARSAGKDDPATGVPIYKSGSFTARYEQVFFGLKPDGVGEEYERYVEQLPSTVETSYLSIPGSMLAYVTATTPAVNPTGIRIPYNIGRPEVLTRISYKWWRVPYEAWRPNTPLYKRVHGDPTNRTLVPITGWTTGNVPPISVTAPPGVGKVVGVPYIGCVSSADMLGFPSGYCLFEGVEEEIVPDPVRGFPCWNLTYKFLVKSVQGGTLDRAEYQGGHNYLYYGGSWLAGVLGTNNQGYFQANKWDKWIPNGYVWDGACLFNERNLLNLWKVGAVPDAEI